MGKELLAGCWWVLAWTWQLLQVELVARVLTWRPRERLLAVPEAWARFCVQGRLARLASASASWELSLVLGLSLIAW